MKLTISNGIYLELFKAFIKASNTKERIAYSLAKDKYEKGRPNCIYNLTGYSYDTTPLCLLISGLFPGSSKIMLKHMRSDFKKVLISFEDFLSAKQSAKIAEIRYRDSQVLDVSSWANTYTWNSLKPKGVQQQTHWSTDRLGITTSSDYNIYVGQGLHQQI